MKFERMIFLVLAWVVSLSSVYGQTKRYEVESGRLEYVVNGSGEMMGMKMSTKGTRTVVFKDWGNVEVIKGKIESTMPMQGTQVENEWSKFDNGKIFFVDEDMQAIISADTSSEMFQQGNQNYSQVGKDFLEQNGGKLIGHEKVQGYKCEIWQWGENSKVWVHKGVMLKSEVSMMGVKNIEEAIRVDFNVKTSNADFSMPNYPVMSMEEAYGQMDEGLSPEEKALMQQMLKSLGN